MQRNLLPSRHLLIATGLLSAAFSAAFPCIGDDSPNAAATAPTPDVNVVIVIADDLGYGETGMMGNSQIPTPHIDELASRGVRFTAGYVTSSYCSPSRAGLLSGRYQSRFGYDRNPVGERNFEPWAGLPEDETTFVRRLNDAGYATALLGKWHLGSIPGKLPNDRGFDRFFGFLHEGHYYVPGPPYRDVWTMIRDKSLPPGTVLRRGNLFRGNYAPINEPSYDHRNPVLRNEDPVASFDYLTDAITAESINFIEQNADHPFCAVVSYGAVHSPMQATIDDVAAFADIVDPQRRIFAGMLAALDRGIGRLTSTIDRLGLKEQTLVIFISDNGGPTRELTSSNAPLRGEKGSLYEGGIRVPFVAAMPGRLPAGSVESRPVISTDIAATVLELAHVEQGKTESVSGDDADENSDDGVSGLSWWGRPDAAVADRTLYWRMPGGKLALRRGRWKIVRADEQADLELFDLESDIAEADDLARTHPQRLAELTASWNRINQQMVPDGAAPANASPSPPDPSPREARP